MGILCERPTLSRYLGKIIKGTIVMHRVRREDSCGLAMLLALVALAGCGGELASPANLVDEPTARPAPLTSSAPTDLATEPDGSAAPSASEAPSSASDFYKPPGWDGTSDLDCPDFDTRDHAQSFFVGTGGSVTNDPYRLDQDHDGDACETLP